MQMGSPIDVRRDSVRKLNELMEMLPRLQRLAEAVGIRRLADLLDTDSRSLSRILSGVRAVPNEIARRTLDVDYVLARALLVFGDANVVVDWLEGTEPMFGFAQPFVVLAKEGVGPLLDVLDRIEAGGYA